MSLLLCVSFSTRIALVITMCSKLLDLNALWRRLRKKNRWKGLCLAPCMPQASPDLLLDWLMRVACEEPSIRHFLVWLFFFFFFCSSWSIMWGLFLTFLFFWWIQIYMAWNLFLHFLVAKRKHVFKPCAVQHKYIIAVKLKLYSWILFLLKHKI